MRPPRALLAPLWFILTACLSRAYLPNPGPYDLVPNEVHDQLVAARQAFEAGRYEEARTLVAVLAQDLPRCLPVRTFAQDAELAELEHRATQHEPAHVLLAEVYRRQADAKPSPEGYVLAARVETDGDEALKLLDQALALDPSCVWARYGKAHWNARLRRFPAAREELKEAFRLDGGHLPTMRLHAWLLSNAGETEPAADCLETWLERTEGDPLTDPRIRAEAWVDLAALQVLSGEPREALSLLERVDRKALVEPARAELVGGAAWRDAGEEVLAMAAARRARSLEKDELLSLVYQALLFGAEGKAMQERTAWQWVLEELSARRAARANAPVEFDESAPLDLREVLVQLQAQARIERLDRELGRVQP